MVRASTPNERPVETVAVVARTVFGRPDHCAFNSGPCRATLSTSMSPIALVLSWYRVKGWRCDHTVVLLACSAGFRRGFG